MGNLNKAIAKAKNKQEKLKNLLEIYDQSKDIKQILPIKCIDCGCELYFKERIIRGFLEVEKNYIFFKNKYQCRECWQKKNEKRIRIA